MLNQKQMIASSIWRNTFLGYVTVAATAVDEKNYQRFKELLPRNVAHYGFDIFHIPEIADKNI